MALRQSLRTSTTGQTSSPTCRIMLSPKARLADLVEKDLMTKAMFVFPHSILKMELTLLKAKRTAISRPTEQRRPRRVRYLSSTTTVASAPSIFQLHGLPPILYTSSTSRFSSTTFTKLPLSQRIRCVHRYCKYQ